MYNFNKGQINFIKIQMENVIKKCKEDIEKYGFGDEATAGSNDCIIIAKSVLRELDK